MEKKKWFSKIFQGFLRFLIFFCLPFFVNFCIFEVFVYEYFWFFCFYFVIFFCFFRIFGFFWVLEFFEIGLDFFCLYWFLTKLLKLLLKVTKNGQKLPKTAQRAKKASTEGWSPPQELEVGPRSGPYLVVSITNENIHLT